MTSPSVSTPMKRLEVESGRYQALSDGESYTDPSVGSSSSSMLLGGDGIMISPARPRQWMPFLASPMSAQGKRMLDRDGDFHQSRGKISIRKRIRSKNWRSLYYADWFHSLVDAPTARIVTILLTGYIVLILIFAAIYFVISIEYGCNMGLDSFQEAFMFSLETMATIGYGTQDVFFDDCWVPMIAVLAQVCTKLVADAVTIGVIYCRLARPQGRASTVLFSNNAVIRRIRGKLYFMFQLCELRKHQLVEAHIRLYTIRHEVDLSGLVKTVALPEASPQISSMEEGSLPHAAVSHFQTCSMRLRHPNDSLGGMLLMCLPQVVVHEIDALSPLMPPPVWVTNKGKTIRRLSPLAVSPVDKNSSEAEKRQLAERAFPLDSSACDDNGGVIESEGLRGYLSAMRATKPESKSKKSKSDAEREQLYSRFRVMEKDMIQEYMTDRRVEIVAIVEGTDAATGGAVQARHSFVVSEVLWDRGFAPCVFEDAEDGSALVDFSLFHELQEVEQDAAFAGVIPSYI